MFFKHTWFHRLQADRLPKVPDHSQSVPVGESAHRSAVHLQENVPAAGKPPGVTNQRLRNYVSDVGELSQLRAASYLHHRDQLPGATPRYGALLHFRGPVLLLLQGLGHCWLISCTSNRKSRNECPSALPVILRRSDARGNHGRLEKLEQLSCVVFHPRELKSVIFRSILPSGYSSITCLRPGCEITAASVSHWSEKVVLQDAGASRSHTPVHSNVDFRNSSSSVLQNVNPREPRAFTHLTLVRIFHLRRRKIQPYGKHSSGKSLTARGKLQKHDSQL